MNAKEYVGFELVRCNDCLAFIPDNINPTQGLGDCRVYQHYVDKWAASNRHESDIDSDRRRLLMDLGNRPDYPLFWATTLVDRTCKKYKPINAVDPEIDKESVE